MDLSAKSTAAIQWANDFVDFDSGTVAGVDVSIDGGASWANVWHGAAARSAGPGRSSSRTCRIAAGHANVQARFHYQGFWAWWWQVDDVEIGAFACTPLPGGLVVGNVTDANTGARLERRHRRKHGRAASPVDDVRDPGGSGAGRRPLHPLFGEQVRNRSRRPSRRTTR